MTVSLDERPRYKEETGVSGTEGGERLILRTDGASRGNPGHAAAGVVIERPDGTVRATGKLYLGVMTNNQAEYRALILGLKSVTRYAPAHVRVHMDSELVVRQMTGQYRVRDESLRPLYDEAHRLAAALPAVSFIHVPRGKNALADKLANEALDAHAAGTSATGTTGSTGTASTGT
jgi:ribonuclease HI